MFQIKNLSLNIGQKNIINKCGVELKNNDILAILGPNGVGKSTLLKAIMNHFSIQKQGDIVFENKKLNKLSTDEIAKLGIFYIAQNPIELNGVQMLDFLKLISNLHEKKTFYEMFSKINNSIKELDLPTDILNRYVNVGFSGGQKKKNEILQAKLTQPKVLLLDEIDSGLDLDGLKIIANYINQQRKNTITIVVSHQIDFLRLIKPNKTLAIIDKNKILHGDFSLIETIEKNGYKQFGVKKDDDFIKEDPYLICPHKPD
jgi:Fe-S cluster assembly ATP-binding protein